MSAEPKRSNCRGCGKPIVWGIEEGTAKKHPLDPVAPVYEVQGFDENTTTVKRHYKAYVSHFATCPDANKFSGQNR